MNVFLRRWRDFFVILAALAALLRAGGRDALAAGLSIRSSDFYPSGAKFTFQASSDGSFDFRLPGAFNQDSVRCLTVDKLSSLRVETLAVVETAPAALGPFEKKAQDAQKSVDLIEGRKSALARTLEMITAPFPASGGGAKVDSGALTGYIAYLNDALKLRLDLEAQIVEANVSLLGAQRALKEANDELEAERARLESKKPFNSGRVLSVSGTTQGAATLLFEAYTPAAGWGVGYEMALDSATGVIKAKMNALAHQRTGMDASGGMSFHTRTPSFAIAVPDVRPLTVDIRSDGNDGWSLAGDMRFSEAMQLPGAPVTMAAPGSPRPAPPQAVSSLANVTISGAGTVEGDGSTAEVTLGGFDLKSAPVLVAIPEQSKEAWIIASVDKVPQAFLPGTAELAVDGASTGTSLIPESVGAIQIPFGMAAKITSKKTPYVSTQGRSWVVKGVREDGYTLEVTSRMEKDALIEVRDRIPLSTTDKVTLEVKKIDPEPAERDKENRLSWKLLLKPGETRKITVEYSVRYPSGETLQYR
ncbi:MAG: DUF4139 domain-containing protein [Synergistaceae bacterium]|jgi:uncharacterized protein (TIGR02231 family)|nr:DUF4139 domain-containing protein [Synergistaceae bacterium]